MQPPSSDAKIVVELLDMENVSSDNDDAIKTEDESFYCPDRNELLEIIETIQIILIFKRWCSYSVYENHVALIID